MSPSPVAQTPPAAPAEALAHFARRPALETDCADVHAAMVQTGGAPPGFVLLDVRGTAAYARSHVPGALSLPHREITAERMGGLARRYPVRRLLRRSPLQRRGPGGTAPG